MSEKEWLAFRTEWKSLSEAFDKSTAFRCRVRGEPYDREVCTRNLELLNAHLAPRRAG